MQLATKETHIGFLAKLFLISAKQSNGTDAHTSAGGTKPVPAFITIQSLATFPGSALAVTIIWRFCDAVFGVNHRAVPVIASFVVAGILYAAAISKDMSKTEKVIGLFIATLNGMYLALSVLGIDVGLGEAGWSQVGGDVG
jgi:hypothetical protein